VIEKSEKRVARENQKNGGVRMTSLSGLIAAVEATASSTATQPSGWGLVGWIAAAIVLFVLAFFVLKFLKKILVNTVLGVLALIIIHYLAGPLGLNVKIGLVSVIVSAVLGLAGVGLLILLALFGFTF